MRLSLVFLLTLSGIAQTLDFKAGLWEITSNVTTTSDPISKKQLDEMLAQVPPQYREATLKQMNEAIAKTKAAGAKGAPTTRRDCLSAGDYQRLGFEKPAVTSCPHEILESTTNKLGVHFTCAGQKTETSYHLHISSPDNIEGVIDYVNRQGDPATTMKTTLSAKWLRASCGPDPAETLAAEKASGASPEVTAFLPYRAQAASSTMFGKHFNYIWPATRLNGPVLLPSIRYVGGLTADRGWEQGGANAYFHGTDGQFLYVTIGSVCSPKYNYKLDKAGVPTPITSIPRGLRGGSDQIGGGSGCQ